MRKQSGIWCTAISSFVVLWASAGMAADQAAVSRTIARVGNEVITSVELDRILAPIKRQLEEKVAKEDVEPQLARARRAALRQLIDRKLIAVQTKETEMQIPSVEIDKQIGKIRAEYATDEDFQAFLDEQRLTREDMRTMVEEDLKVKVLFHEKVVRRVRVSPSEIHDYYQLHVSEFLQPAQVHMYQILIKKTPDDAQGLQRAKDVLSEIKVGANFQQVARLRSEGPKRAEGGDWGMVNEGFFGEEMAEVEKAAFKLSAGQCSDIVESRYGYHIVYIDQKKPSHILTEEQAYNDIYNRIFQEKIAQVYDDYIQGLRDKTYVEFLDGSAEDLPSSTTTLPVGSSVPSAGKPGK